MTTIPQLELYRSIEEAVARGERVVVATVAHTRGSTPQRRGAKMLFFENGETAGTVGGGCVEAEVWAEARETMRDGNPALHHFALTADEASEEGMVCGGTMDVAVQTINSPTQPDGSSSTSTIPPKSWPVPTPRYSNRKQNGKNWGRFPTWFLSKAWFATEIAGSFITAPPTSTSESLPLRRSRIPKQKSRIRTSRTGTQSTTQPPKSET